MSRKKDAKDDVPLRQVTDPRTLRAVTHPVRLALLEALAVHGELTATEAGELIDESPTTCSFHLRQLAKYGFVEEAGSGPGRRRPWRLVHVGWQTDDTDGDAEFRGAAAALDEVTLDRYVQRHRQSRQAASAYPRPWQSVGSLSQTIWWATPDEARELEQELEALFFRFRERLVDPGSRPAGSAPVEVVAFTHLMQPPSATPDAGPQRREPGGP